MRGGPNVLGRGEVEPWWEELLESLGEPLQLLLVAVGVAYFAFGEIADGLTILVVILAVSAVEVTNELRAKRAVAALNTLAAPSAVVVRDGAAVQIPARDVVPGDLVLLEAGHRVPADLRLVESVALRIDESSLTGEALPVAKSAGARLPPATELGDRVTMAFTSTVVTGGRGRGIAVATGAATAIGRIAGLAAAAREPRTPLQRAMRELSRWLLAVAIAFSVLVPVLGAAVAGRPIREMILTGLTLAFATIPEELPILITIVLGIGAYRLARRHAIVKHLRAAETLGSVSVVATDKTGTLTENRMRLVAVVAGTERLTPATTAQSMDGRRLLETAVYASDAELAGGGAQVTFVGDPTEAALLRAAADAGLDVAALRHHTAIVEERPFDDARKRMSVVRGSGDGWCLELKGAPEAVLPVCSHLRVGDDLRPLDDTTRVSLAGIADELSAEGLRTLALAQKTIVAAPLPGTPVEALERDLVLLGFVALEDPPRPEAAAAVAALTTAGARVVIVTGDHPETARAIAARVGIPAARVVRGRELDGRSPRELLELVRSCSIFARIAPEHKLGIVRALQSAGEVVAVTGDGVNDAPALREAAIGIAMGRVGTDVAREAADLVLADDDLATVTEAVRTGRVLFANLRKAVRYYLAAKLALVTASLVAVLLGLPVPFDPVQIIVMELFMDLGASVTFVAEPPEEDVMRRAPRDPHAPFMDREMTLGILAGGVSLAAAVLVSYLVAWRWWPAVGVAKTAAFAAWMIGHIVLAAHMRTERQRVLARHVPINRPYLAWALAAIGVVVVASAIPLLRARLHVMPIAPATWLVVVAAAVLLPSWWEPWKVVRARLPAAR